MLFNQLHTLETKTRIFRHLHVTFCQLQFSPQYIRICPVTLTKLHVTFWWSARVSCRFRPGMYVFVQWHWRICTSHFGAQPLSVAIFAPVCTYLSSDTDEVARHILVLSRCQLQFSPRYVRICPVTLTKCAATRLCRHVQCCTWYCSGLPNSLYCQHSGLW